ncbi:uncharacterized protein LOC134106184 [Pungitius pungitius]|uniref:uncharacterized protein LOC134106184 n=1 Tax=Pungitius pungitius TaxID=134920 RepID=UPI002E0FD41F
MVYDPQTACLPVCFGLTAPRRAGPQCSRLPVSERCSAWNIGELGSVRSGPGPDEAVWREPGEAVTVRCRSSHPKPEYLSLMTGRGTVAPEYRGRLRCSETFPDVDVVIDPVTPADAGRYECVYLKYDRQRRPVELPGTGSVFLVMPQPSSPGERCRDERWDDIPPTTLATCAFVVLVVVVVAWCFAWTLLKACRMSKEALRRWRQRQERKKLQRFPLDDVYEDMNATVAR